MDNKYVNEVFGIDGNETPMSAYPLVGIEEESPSKSRCSISCNSNSDFDCSSSESDHAPK